MPDDLNADFRTQISGASLGDEKAHPEPALASAGAGNYPPGRTAVGAAGGGSPHYGVGEELECIILAERPGGYEILILKHGVEGFLKTVKTRKIGSTLVAQFVYWQDKPRE